MSQMTWRENLLLKVLQILDLYWGLNAIKKIQCPELKAPFRFLYMLETYFNTELFIHSCPSSTHSKLLLMDLICSQFDLTGRQLAANKTTSDYFGAAADHVSYLRQQRAARIIGSRHECISACNVCIYLAQPEWMHAELSFWRSGNEFEFAYVVQPLSALPGSVYGLLCNPVKIAPINSKS